MTDHDSDVAPEEATMTAFIDAPSHEAAATLAELRTTLATTIETLERKDDPHYQAAIRMLLATDACFAHAIAELRTAERAQHDAWRERQREATAFLELRTAETMAEFLVAKTHAGDRRRWPGLPADGERFRFSIVTPGVGVLPGFGGPIRGARRAQLEIWTGVSFERKHTIPLQVLHRAFQDRVVIEMMEIASGYCVPSNIDDAEAVAEVLEDRSEQRRDPIGTFEERAAQMVGLAPLPTLAELSGPIDVEPVAERAAGELEDVKTWLSAGTVERARRLEQAAKDGGDRDDR